MNILDKIIKNKKKEVKELKEKFSFQREKITPPFPIRDFKSSISQNNRVNLIAEVKKASPSAGVIREEFFPVEIAKQYEEAGAASISVLTDEKFFKGNLSYLKKIKKETKIPLLRKDFIIHGFQIYESLKAGADAILLIADVLDLAQLRDYINIASKYKMSCLVESHTKKSVEKSLKAGAEIIGINNRNLNTFQVDLDTTRDLKKVIPKDKIVVSESGIKEHKDIKYLKQIGVNAVLVGETFIQAGDIIEKVNKIMGKKE